MMNNSKMNKWEYVTEVKQAEQDTAKGKKLNEIMNRVTQYTLRDMTKVFENIYSGEEIKKLIEQETDIETLVDRLKEMEAKTAEQIYQKGFMMCLELFNKA